MDNDNTRASSAASRRTAPHLLSQLPTVQTGPGITITSRDALLFWENHRLRWRLAALSRLWQAQKNDNPWADDLLWQLDQVMSASRSTLVALQTRLDTELAGLPPGVVLTAQDFSQGVSPGNIASCPPVGFFVMLFGLFDRALLTLLQVRMTGLHDLRTTEAWRTELNQCLLLPLSLLQPGPGLSAAHSTVRRADLLQLTPLARQWLSRTAMPPADVLAGTARSRWQSPLHLPSQVISAIRSLPEEAQAWLAAGSGSEDTVDIQEENTVRASVGEETADTPVSADAPDTGSDGSGDDDGE
ncbi:TPA: DUF1845 family protein [Klebsiella oxytoca]|nr:DUF1845 family protein [Klebsiella oxytoca]